MTVAPVPTARDVEIVRFAITTYCKSLIDTLDGYPSDPLIKRFRNGLSLQLEGMIMGDPWARTSARETAQHVVNELSSGIKSFAETDSPDDTEDAS